MKLKINNRIVLLLILLILLILLSIIIYKKFKNNKEIKETFEINNQIPKVIYLSYKNKNIPKYIIPNWQKLYPNYEIKLYDNNDCIKFLKDEYSQEFADIFNMIKDGPIKADFWRVCILYKYGGIYADIDIEPLVSIESILNKNTTFLSCISQNTIGITPQFIVSIPKHKALKMCIDKYLEMYRTKKDYSYWGWSICGIMKDVFYEIHGKHITTDGVYIDNENNKYQMLKEVYPTKSDKDHYCKYNNIKILNNRYSDYDNKNHIF
jgi:mannosyltransferase OCH1-like enzyme